MKDEILWRIIDTSKSGYWKFYRNSNIGLGLRVVSYFFLRVNGRIFSTSDFTHLKLFFSAMTTSRIFFHKSPPSNPEEGWSDK
jgi:hypothetical protein